MELMNLDFLLGLVCREHGQWAVKFALNVEDGQPWSEVSWTKNRLEVLQGLVGGVMLADLQHEGQSRQFRNAVHGYVPTSGESIFREMRKRSGGDLLSIEEGVDESHHPAVSHLRRLINRYEVDIRVLADRADSSRVCPSIFGDQDGGDLIKALLTEDSLAPLQAALEPSSVAAGMRFCRVITPSTSSGLYEELIPEYLLQACVSRSLVEGQALTAVSMRSHSQAVVDDFIALLSGQPVKVPIAVAALGSHFVGAGTESMSPLQCVTDADKVPVGDGYLRPTTQMDRRLFPMAQGQMGLVWVTVEETRVEVRPPSADGGVADVPIDNLDGFEPVWRRWDLVSEAIILAAPEYPPPAWVIADIFKPSVVQPWEMSTSARVVVGDVAKNRAIVNDLGDVVAWHERLSQHRNALVTSRRRLVSAVTSRNDPVDSLVDAVVAWEGIFSGSPETQMRTVYPSCKLLSSDEMVVTTLKQMKNVYGLRSKLVHGSPKNTTNSKICAARDDSVRWVINLLHTLFIEHPHLLYLTATERSEAVLLPGSHPKSTPIGPSRGDRTPPRG